MRVLVCGGRDFTDEKFVWSKLSELNQSEGPFTTLIHGDAPGVDTYAKNWGKENQLQVIGFPAEWDKYGNMAGRIRNGVMLREGRPELVIAFPGNRGTANMIRQARNAGIWVLDINNKSSDYILNFMDGV